MNIIPVEFTLQLPAVSNYHREGAGHNNSTFRIIKWCSVTDLKKIYTVFSKLIFVEYKVRTARKFVFDLMEIISELLNQGM